MVLTLNVVVGMALSGLCAAAMTEELLSEPFSNPNGLLEKYYNSEVDAFMQHATVVRLADGTVLPPQDIASHKRHQYSARRLDKQILTDGSSSSVDFNLDDSARVIEVLKSGLSKNEVRPKFGFEISINDIDGAATTVHGSNYYGGIDNGIENKYRTGIDNGIENNYRTGIDNGIDGNIHDGVKNSNGIDNYFVPGEQFFYDDALYKGERSAAERPLDPATTLSDPVNGALANGSLRSTQEMFDALKTVCVGAEQGCVVIGYDEANWLAPVPASEEGPPINPTKDSGSLGSTLPEQGAAWTTLSPLSYAFCTCGILLLCEW